MLNHTQWNTSLLYNLHLFPSAFHLTDQSLLPNLIEVHVMNQGLQNITNKWYTCHTLYMLYTVHVIHCTCIYMYMYNVYTLYMYIHCTCIYTVHVYTHVHCTCTCIYIVHVYTMFRKSYEPGQVRFGSTTSKQSLSLLANYSQTLPTYIC